MRGKDKKKTKRTTKIVYRKCYVCGGRKKESDMLTTNDGTCQECFKKQLNLSSNDRELAGAAKKYERMVRKKL